MLVMYCLIKASKYDIQEICTVRRILSSLLTVPLTLEDVISVLKSVLQDDAPVAIRQACGGLKVLFSIH